MAVHLQDKHYRYLVFVFNIIFCLMGMLIISFGVWVQVYSSEIDTGYQRQREITNAAILLITAGVFIVCVVAVGNYAACKQERNILTLYTVLVLLVFTLEIAAGLYAYDDRHHLIIDYRLKNSRRCTTNLGETNKEKGDSQKSLNLIGYRKSPSLMDNQKLSSLFDEGMVSSKDESSAVSDTQKKLPIIINNVLTENEDKATLSDKSTTSSKNMTNISNLHLVKEEPLLPVQKRKSRFTNIRMHSRDITRNSSCSKSRDFLIKVELIIAIVGMMFALVQIGGVLLLIKLHALYSPELQQYNNMVNV